MNRDNLMSQLRQMQERLQKNQEEIENRVAEATAGGGAVSVTINGAYKLTALKIDRDAVDPEDVALLEDLVMAAVNEALQKVQSFHNEQMSGLTGGMDLSSLGLGGLPGEGGAEPRSMAPLNRAARRQRKK